MFRHTKRTGRWMAIAVAIGLLCSFQALAKKPPPADETPSYTCVDLLGLPDPGFLQSDAYSVSEPDADGALFVAGNSWYSGSFYPVLWSVEADGSFAGPIDLGGPASSREAAVNDAGIVATFSGHVFVPGRDIQQLPAAGGVAAHATAINNSDQIVGWIDYDDEGTRYGEGALWTLDEFGTPGDPVILDEGLQEGVSFIPMDISDTGVMAGDLVHLGTAAVAWFEGRVLEIDPLAALPGFDWSQAEGISSDGTWVAGTCSRSEGSVHAFLYSVTTAEMTGLVGLAGEERNSFAWDVNSAGHVVGASDTGEGRYSMTAALWRDGQVLDLNKLSDAGNKVHIDIGTGINNAGQIVGMMRISRPVSEAHGFVMIPNEP